MSDKKVKFTNKCIVCPLGWNTTTDTFSTLTLRNLRLVGQEFIEKELNWHRTNCQAGSMDSKIVYIAVDGNIRGRSTHDVVWW